MPAQQTAGLPGQSWLAVLVSVGLHALVLLSLVAFAAPGVPGGRPGNGIDTRVADVDVEFTLLLPEPPRPAPRPAPAVAPPPAVPVPSAVAAALPRPEAVPQPVAPAAPARPSGTEAGTGTGSGQGGGGGTTAFFHVTAHGQAIVYVIDRSASMGLNGALTAAQRELRASLERLPPTARFQVIAYNRSAEPLHVGGRADLLPATPDNKARAAALVAALRAEGGTEHLAALRRALALRPDVIYFLTDADDLRPDQVLAITQLNHGRTIIHALELRPEERRRRGAALPVLAQNNHGEYRAIVQAPSLK
jgi:hypothetical protein